MQAASNGKHVELCLEMLVSNFTPPYSFMGILKQPRGIARKDQVLSRVHSALKHIADLVPLAPSKLSTIVSQKIPIYAKEPVSSISNSQYEIQVHDIGFCPTFVGSFLGLTSHMCNLRYMWGKAVCLTAS